MSIEEVRKQARLMEEAVRNLRRMLGLAMAAEVVAKKALRDAEAAAR